MRSIRVQLIWLLVLGVVLASCPPRHTFRIDSDTSTSCVPCPENCSICFVSLTGDLHCAFCLEGFYADQKKECKACQPNCHSCIGPELHHCKSPRSGYFYDPASSRLERCEAEGCSKCSSKSNCHACMDGYYEWSPEEAGTGHTGSSPTIDAQVVCKPCNIPDCVHCSEKKDQMKKNSFVSCSLCQGASTLLSGVCRKCPDHCSACKDQTRECAFCDNQYFLRKETNECLKTQTEHCLIPSLSGDCSTCESHYYLTDEKTCQLCASKISKCSFCTSRNNEVICLACQSGHYLEGESCLACPEDCIRCEEGRCLSCRFGYFYDTLSEKCLPCSIPNCEMCKSADMCLSCLDGFYFDKSEKKCLKCSENCLTCSESADNCDSCSLLAFRLEDQIITQKAGGAAGDFFSGFLGLFMGFFPPLQSIKMTQIQIVTKCLSECPTTHGGKPVVVDHSERKCVVSSSGMAPKPLFGAVHPDEDLHEKVRAFRIKYNQEIEEIKSKSVKKGNDLSPECYRNGRLKREVEADRASYFVCQCEPGFVGDNCQITLELYHETQKKLLEFCDAAQSQFVDHNHHNKKKFISTLIHISRFRVGHHVIRRMIQLIDLFIQIDHEIDNRKRLYLLYDSLLLALYDLLEESRKSKKALRNLDIGVQKRDEETFELVGEVIQRLETSLHDHKYTHSFLEEGSESYKALNTFSFIISEFKLANLGHEGVSFSTPNIDTSFDIATKNRVTLEFDLKVDVNRLTSNLQAIALSYTLFTDKFRDHRHKPLSNLLYLRLIDPNDLHREVTVRENGIASIVVQFALNYLPVYDDVLSHVVCMGHFFADPRLNVVGKAREISGDEKTITCQFFTNFEPKNYYFVVLIKE